MTMSRKTAGGSAPVRNHAISNKNVRSAENPILANVIGFRIGHCWGGFMLSTALEPEPRHRGADSTGNAAYGQVGFPRAPECSDVDFQGIDPLIMLRESLGVLFANFFPFFHLRLHAREPRFHALGGRQGFLLGVL